MRYTNTDNKEFTLVKTTVKLKSSGINQNMKYFIRDAEGHKEIPLPNGYEVAEDKITKVPLLRKLKQ